MEDYTAEELKTVIGQIFYDLRQGWLLPHDRVYKAEKAINTLFDNHPEEFPLEDFRYELKILGNFKQFQDGRHCMNSHLYGHDTPEGNTERVRKTLSELDIKLYNYHEYEYN